MQIKLVVVEMTRNRNTGKNISFYRIPPTKTVKNRKPKVSRKPRVSLGESDNGLVIPDHMDSSTPKKRKIRKRIILS